MNYPTELQRMISEQDAKKFKEKVCVDSKNGGCYCTGKCKGYSQDIEKIRNDKEQI